MIRMTVCRVLSVVAGLAWGLAMAGPALGREAIDFKAAQPPAGAIWLDGLDLSKVNQGWGEPRAGRSCDNRPLKLKGVTYPHGLGTHASSEVTIVLDGCATRFAAMVGVDDEVGEKGTVSFEVWLDGKRVAETPVLKGGGEPRMISADLVGGKQMTLVVENGGDGINYDHADWGGAVIFLVADAKTRPKTVLPGDSEPPMPIAHGTAPEPRINNPRIVGTTPGRSFLFLIPATGEGPLEFSAEDLPGGLNLDSRTGIITGSLEKEGEYVVTLRVKGPKGSDMRKLTIVGGEHKLALTPPMGWNSWNCWGCAVDADKIKAAADAMIKSGLAAHGFQYINIDDCWEAGRNDKGEIQTNEKFPDMAALGEYVHSKGLRFGIYSSPGPKTCAGYEASYQHEEQDAKTWANWGVDYVKYDWCSYGGIAKGDSLDELQKPYRVMRAALDKCDRDIVYSLCQYGMGEVWKWGGKVGGNLWRTTGDIVDTWQSMASIGFAHSDRSPYVRPGQWNDPDMLVVGKVGWGPSLHPSRLTHNEQITHITLWSLLAAPLLIGCDMSALDAFTVDLLGNDEVLDVDQDPLGKAAVRVAQEGTTEVWARPLSDGTMAVGLFNRGRATAKVTAKWSDLKLSGKQLVRDLWQKKDVGRFEDTYTHEVRAHGAALVKIGKPQG
ncbi:MAG: NPCBM/NEW2 domain-containing protein [Phycisphaerae bacterium]|nr:NPCBM/NEW2 domain-containing protein [Phycisphaerae bacterium]